MAVPLPMAAQSGVRIQTRASPRAVVPFAAMATVADPSVAAGVEAQAPDAGPKHCPACGERYPDDYAVCPRDATPLVRENASGDPLIGQILGDTYEITRLLGEGGMGRIYEARHVRLGRRFALKLLHPHFANDAESVARFRREAIAAAAVSSPHVAQVFDVAATREGRPYMVSELLEGEDLAALIRRDGPIDVGRAVAIARDVCKGLAAAHAAGVVHRDLKPENVFVVRDAAGRERAKVLDFGIAKSLSDDASLTRTGVVLGTPAYMAPEQVRSSAHCDHRVDVYALGAMLYRALTGRPAFSGEDPSATLTSVLYDEPARPKALRREIPDGLELVIQRAMAKSPDERFASMEALDMALAPFDTSETPTPAASARESANAARASVGELARAETVALRSAAAAAVANAELQGQRARLARPRALILALLLTLWGVLAIASLVGAVIHAATRRPLEHVEVVLALALAGVTMVPALLAWARGLWRGAWRNTAAMLSQADALAEVSAASLGVYALVSSTWRAAVWLGERSLGVSRWADVSALSASLAAGVLVAVLRRRALHGGR